MRGPRLPLITTIWRKGPRLIASGVKKKSHCQPTQWYPSKSSIQAPRTQIKWILWRGIIRGRPSPECRMVMENLSTCMGKMTHILSASSMWALFLMVSCMAQERNWMAQATA
jgi:hypothetical protein